MKAFLIILQLLPEIAKLIQLAATFQGVPDASKLNFVLGALALAGQAAPAESPLGALTTANGDWKPIATSVVNGLHSELKKAGVITGSAATPTA